MSGPEGYFFRLRGDGGVQVFRVGETRQRRLEMTQVAVANLSTGKVRAHGDHVLTEADTAAIADWMAERAELEEVRRLDDVHRTVDALNRTAYWVQSQATSAELSAVGDTLLMAMHDLRSVLVRRRANASRERDGETGRGETAPPARGRAGPT